VLNVLGEIPFGLDGPYLWGQLTTSFLERFPIQSPRLLSPHNCFWTRALHYALSQRYRSLDGADLA